MIRFAKISLRAAPGFGRARKLQASETYWNTGLSNLHIYVRCGNPAQQIARH